MGNWTRLYVSGLGGKLVEYSDGGTKFFVTNHLGTIAARMDLSGQLMETYRYLPYGERYAGTQTTHQYTGKERDAESGLDYFGARYYASAHGRWMGVDPVLGDMGNPQRLNRYSYVGNDPIGTIDPDGTDWHPAGCHIEWELFPEMFGDIPPMPYEVCDWYWLSRNAYFRQNSPSQGGAGSGAEGRDFPRTQQFQRMGQNFINNELSEQCKRFLGDHGKPVSSILSALDRMRFWSITQFRDMLVSDLPNVTGTFGDGSVTLASFLGPGAGRVVTNDAGNYFPHVVFNPTLFGRSTTIPGTVPDLDPFHEALHYVFGRSDVDLANFFGLGTFEEGQEAQASQAISLWFDPKHGNCGAGPED